MGVFDAFGGVCRITAREPDRLGPDGRELLDSGGIARRPEIAVHEAKTGERPQAVLLLVVHEQERQRRELEQQFGPAVAIEIAAQRPHAVVARHPAREPRRIILPRGIERVARAAAAWIKGLRPAIRGDGLPVAVRVIKLCKHDRLVVLANPTERCIRRIDRGLGVEVHAAKPFLHRLALGIEPRRAAGRAVLLGDHEAAVAVGGDALQTRKVPRLVAAEPSASGPAMRGGGFAGGIEALHLLNRAPFGDDDPAGLGIHVEGYCFPQAAHQRHGLLVFASETHHGLADEREDRMRRPEGDVAHVGQWHRVERVSGGRIEP